VTFLIIALYKYSYFLLTYLLAGSVVKTAQGQGHVLRILKSRFHGVHRSPLLCRFVLFLTFSSYSRLLNIFIDQTSGRNSKE